MDDRTNRPTALYDLSRAGLTERLAGWGYSDYYAGLVWAGLYRDLAAAPEAIAGVAAELAARLAREERSARGSLELARRQARLNRLVIEEMADGVLVVDRELRVRTSNPAARSLLAVPGTGLQPNFQLQGRTEWAALAQAVRRALAEGRWPAAGEEVTLHVGAGDTRTLRMRVRFTRRKGARGWPAGEEYCVLLLEDVRTVRARIRQEKLAAMGRVSAGIAHEIRNPLAAIAQANALLLEDPLPEPQARLARIVADNVQRLRRMEDDVLEAVPSATVAAPAAVDADAVVAAAADEWARTEGIEIGGRLRLELPRQPLMVRFDAEHLQRVLVNLLDNALRHATAAPGAIGVRLALRDEATALLLVDSDGLRLGGALEAPGRGDVSEATAATLAAVAAEAGRAARLLELGDWSYLTVEGAERSACVLCPSAEAVLLATMDAGLPAGQLIFYAERGAKSARAWLERVR